VPLTFVSMAFLVLSTYMANGFSGLFRPGPGSLIAGLVSALALYALFFAGGMATAGLGGFGLGQTQRHEIYSLVVSQSNTLQTRLLLLAFDSVGYESFFRGALQRRLSSRLGRNSVFASAVVDAAVHALTLNPLWVATTFVADVVWGSTYRYTGDLSASMLSHFSWDVLVFILFPLT
jgi:membrane protease YdiL (CAAX protease family)